MKTTIISDVDGTLLNNVPFQLKIEEEMANILISSNKLPEEEAKQMVHNIFWSGLVKWYNPIKEMFGEDIYMSLARNYDYLLEINPGAKELVDNYNVFAISGTPKRYLKKKLESLDLWQNIEGAFSEDEGFPKDKKTAEKILRKIPLRNKIIVIGDIIKDMEFGYYVSLLRRNTLSILVNNSDWQIFPWHKERKPKTLEYAKERKIPIIKTIHELINNHI